MRPRSAFASLPYTKPQLVNRHVEAAMYGGPPARWAVFPHGTVVLFPADAVSDVSVAFEAQRHLRRKSTNAELNTCPVFNPTIWWVFFETIADGPAVFGMYFPRKDDEDARYVALSQLRARVLDSSCDVACTSCNIGRDRTEEQSNTPKPFQTLAGQMTDVRNSLQDSSESDSDAETEHHWCD